MLVALFLRVFACLGWGEVDRAYNSEESACCFLFKIVLLSGGGLRVTVDPTLFQVQQDACLTIMSCFSLYFIKEICELAQGRITKVKQCSI